MTVSAVEMEEEDVPRNLQNTLFELFVWNGSILNKLESFSLLNRHDPGNNSNNSATGPAPQPLRSFCLSTVFLSRVVVWKPKKMETWRSTLELIKSEQD
jgi:hypothetical protein